MSWPSILLPDGFSTLAPTQFLAQEALRNGPFPLV
jgi:hypothetical protein